MVVPVEIEILMEVPHPPGFGRQFIEEAYDYSGDVVESAANYMQSFLAALLRWSPQDWPDVKRVTRKAVQAQKEQMKIIREITGEEIY
jgi:hypothetical protein